MVALLAGLDGADGGGSGAGGRSCETAPFPAALGAPGCVLAAFAPNSGPRLMLDMLELKLLSAPLASASPEAL